MISLHGYLRSVASVLATKLPPGRGVSTKDIEEKYQQTLEAIPEQERDKKIADAIKDIEDIIKKKEIPDDIQELYVKWKIGDFSEYMKYLKGTKTLEVEEEEKTPEKKEPDSEAMVPEKVRLFFMAPDEASTETITDQGNFQWIGYELTFKVGAQHYVYRTPLWPWGEEKKGGDQIVLESDPQTDKIEESGDFTLDQVKRGLEKYRAVSPNTGPDIYKALNNISGFFYNVDKNDSSTFNVDNWKKTSKRYTYEDFNKKFRDSGFYKLVSKSDKKLVNP